MKMEGWVKIGVQRASVLNPNSCYNEPCYIEVQVYSYIKWNPTMSFNMIFIKWTSAFEALFYT